MLKNPKIFKSKQNFTIIYQKKTHDFSLKSLKYVKKSTNFQK